MNIRKSQGPLVYKSPFLAEPKRKPNSSALHRSTSPRAGHLVKVPEVRPTRKICQERFACKRPLRVAVYDCVDCHTLQCDVCETLIHENPKFVFHDRKRLQFPREDVICELNCETRNYADVFCKPCNKRLCFSCDLITHQFKSSQSHYRVPFELDEFFSIPRGPEFEPPKLEESSSLNDQEEFLSFIPEEQPIPLEHAVKPENSLSKFELNSLVRTDEDSINSDCEYNSIENPPTMMSMHTMHNNTMNSYPDVLSSTEEINKLNLNSRESVNKSFLLVDDQETLQVRTEEEFIDRLGCKPETQLKVISIFGNTGEGKSHTLNHTFFDGVAVFPTSDSQVSCTIGVWAAYNQKQDVLILDTEGLLGLTANQNQRTRLLLKVIAVSDIIIYRTRAERLHNDLFTFLGDASKAYVHHFAKELQAASKRFNFDGPLSSLGPSVIVFHETVNTKVLCSATEPGKQQLPEDELKYRFRELGLTIDAFSNLVYAGTQTLMKNTSFSTLALSIKNLLNNSAIRSARTPRVIYQLLKALNDKFNGDIEKTVANTFPDQYFTCNAMCQSCNSRCMHSMNHIGDGVLHDASEKCRWQHQFDNKILLCRKCYERGDPIRVIPKTSSSAESSWLGLVKYAWAGYVIECTNCGVIYRSREYWYGNKDPWETTVRTEYHHVWPGELGSSQTNQNAAQRVIDSVAYISDAVTSVSAKPTKTITSWVADQFAPSYWQANYKILKCAGKCEKEFGPLDKKHHCRACGEGFCEDCSSKTKPVPERGWGPTPVRVCDKCYELSEPDPPVGELDETTVTVRKVGEVLQSAIGTVATGITYPMGFIKDSARPSYWVADDQITNCIICKSLFSAKLSLHHCRACGNGVCEACSQTNKPVPSRGWDYPVRVCESCAKKEDL